MKMALDAPTIPFAKSNLSLLIDVKILLGLNVIVATYPWARDQGKGLQRCGPRVNLRVTFHAPGSAGECEGMNPHNSQVSSHFWNWSPNGLLNFQRAISKVKTHWIKKFLISLKISWNVDE